jgi:competence protein ComEC
VRSLSVLLAWCVVGLIAGVTPSPRPDAALRVTVLDVGHGGAVLVESGGRRLLFDCGSMEDDRRVAESVWRAVRGDGGPAVETVLLSHADLDHCNNLPALLRTGPVGGVAMPRSFLDLDQRVVRDACDAMRVAGVRTRLVAAGDVFRLGPDVTATVLHPPDRPPAADDNANSAVLRVSCAGRTILITGDLEGAGQAEVFEREPAGGCDVLIAPHHGGLKANTPEFAAWARPRDVIVSCSDRVNAKALTEVYPQARLHLTPRTGAVTVTIGAGGTVAVTPFVRR